MAENQLRKLEAEKDRLQAELKTLEDAISTREACEDLIKFVEKSPEPLAADAQKDNLWTSAPKQDTGCSCVIM